MTHGGRLTRWITAVLLAVGLATVAPAAHANTSPSPHQTVTRFWNLLSNGHGAQAFLNEEPSCRTAKDRKALVQAGNQLAKLPLTIHIENYREKVHNRTALVSYKVVATIKGRDHKLNSVPAQKWVLIHGRWFGAC